MNTVNDHSTLGQNYKWGRGEGVQLPGRRCGITLSYFSLLPDLISIYGSKSDPRKGRPEKG